MKRELVVLFLLAANVIVFAARPKQHASPAGGRKEARSYTYEVALKHDDRARLRAANPG